MSDPNAETNRITWKDLSTELQETLNGKLAGLWGHPTDEDAFDSLAIDKQQALLITVPRLKKKDVWQLITKIENVYGEGGTGVGFSADPSIVETLRGRRDFTRFMANHKGTSGGFYEKGRATAVLHFIWEDGPPQKWYVHFDLHSPVYSPLSAFKHLRFEYFGKITPGWQIIKDCFVAEP